MIRRFCTYFNSRYLPQGLAMLHSLVRHSPGCEVLVWALDERTAFVLPEYAPAGVRVELRKPDAAGVEAIWRMTPTLVLAAMDRWDDVAYVDADLFFFSDPAPIYAECDAGVSIIPHRWHPWDEKRLRPNGIYNVGWVRFRGARGKLCAYKWQFDCERSELRAPDGRFSDQIFLDTWPADWDAHIVTHLGANLAPYNQRQYAYSKGNPPRIGENGDPLLFYHFHEFRWRLIDRAVGIRRTGYALHPFVESEVYPPYETEIVKWIVLLNRAGYLTSR